MLLHSYSLDSSLSIYIRLNGSYFSRERSRVRVQFQTGGAHQIPGRGSKKQRLDHHNPLSFEPSARRDHWVRCHSNASFVVTQAHQTRVDNAPAGVAVVLPRISGSCVPGVSPALVISPCACLSASPSDAGVLFPACACWRRELVTGWSV